MQILCLGAGKKNITPRIIYILVRDTERLKQMDTKKMAFPNVTMDLDIIMRS
jgi:hypothetical protein